MRFEQKEDGSCEIIFSNEELKIINNEKKLYLTSETLRHFGNVLMAMVHAWNEKFDEKTKKLITETDTTVEGTNVPNKK